MDKWEKVIELHRLFGRNNRPIPLASIIGRLDCSEATFHRLRKFMRDTLGAPIIFDARYHGYRYDTSTTDRFELPGLWLTSHETEALLGFHQAIESLQEGFFNDVFGPVKKNLSRFLKSQNLRPASPSNPVRIIPLQSRPIDESLFRIIADAIVGNRTIEINHVKLSGEPPVKRIVSPQTLVRYRDNWYLDAFCHLRNELRTFALDRISSALFSTEKFHRVPKKERELFFADAYGIFTGPAVATAHIRFYGPAAELVSREQWHPRQHGEWTDDHRYLLAIPYGDDRELVMDILKWGECAEVISPVELRNKVKSLLIKTLRHYEK